MSPPASEPPAGRRAGRGATAALRTPLGFALAALTLVAVLGLVNHRLWLGRAVPIWDADLAFAPWYMLVADFARAGRLLLWDPWSNAGAPHWIDPDTGALAPTTLAFAWLSGARLGGFVAYWLAIWAAAGLGLLGLGRHLGVPAAGALAVSLSFLSNGFLTGHASHTSTLHAFAVLPFVLWRLDVALVNGRLRPALEAGAIWGAGGLAGYPALVAIGAGLALLWCAGRAWLRPARGALVAARVYGGMILTGLIVLSPAYLGLLFEGRGYTDRSGPLPREVAVGIDALHPSALATWASPYLGSLETLDPALRTYTDITGANVYAGALVTGLALLALLARPRSAWRWWLLAIGLLGVGLALGRALPLRGWLYDALPPARYFRHANLFRSLGVLSLALLALYGARDLLVDGLAGRRVRIRVAAGAWLLLGGAALTLRVGLGALGEPAPRAGLAWLHLAALWGIPALLALGAAARSARGPGPGAGPAPGRARRTGGLLVALALADVALSHELSRATLYETRAAARKHWAQLEERHRGDLGLATLARNIYPGTAHYKHLIPKLPVLHAYTPISLRLHERMARELPELAKGPERLWFAESVLELAPDEHAFDVFVARTRRLGGPPLVIHARERLLDPGAPPSSPQQRAHLARAPAATRLGAELLAYEPDRLHLRVDVPADGWLVVTDRWARGWQARVDGRPRELRGGLFAYRAVPVQRGVRELEFRYRPFAIPWLLAASWLTLAGVAGASLAAAWRRAAASSTRGGARPAAEEAGAR